MRVVVETMTPNAAKEILMRSEGQAQRALARDRVARFAHDIKSGNWMITHQPIALDRDGILIDGQHRLHAIVLSETAVNVTIAYDVDPDTFRVIDTGGARNPGATLKLAGFTDTNVLSAAVRMYLGYKANIGKAVEIGSWSRGNISVADMLDYVNSKEGEEMPAFVLRAGTIANALGRYGTRSFVAAALHAIRDAGASDEILAEFTEKVAHGSMLPANSPILTFRRWVISETGLSRVSAHYRSQAGFMALIRVYNGWMQGEELQVIRIKPGKDRLFRPVGKRMTDEQFAEYLLEGVEEAKAEEKAKQPKRKDANLLEGLEELTLTGDEAIQVRWSPDDNQFVARTKKFPDLQELADTADDAEAALLEVIKEELAGV